MEICIAIVGPTASGKSQLALNLAKAIGGEILCLDSTTVYEGFDIGTAKPNKEELDAIPHHLVSILKPDEIFSAYDFIARADKIISEINQRKRVPIVVGGTFFYLRALQNGMYPAEKVPPDVVEQIESDFWENDALNSVKMHEELKKIDATAASKIHPNDRYRLVRALAIWRHCKIAPSELKPQPISESQKNRLWTKYAVISPRHQLTQRIAERAQEMLNQGLVNEAKALRQSFPNARPLRSIGYAEAVAHLEGTLSEKELLNEIIEKTRQLAKRQITWIRSDPEIRFVDLGDLERMKLEHTNLRATLAEDSGT